ncbi:hypothetical protein I6A84_04570 [Frankia sp. CNm7]|uniref:Uncharacterized protein n=1 Tax=Frankia nepalensis TaxID=1836974 RepID=A0A937RF35_9ACTN|nr:hypothetical protein [Frankia nepalensis]MBL7498722.1 hypothetical protein [Frankia nepalensis]MBL7508413.1 hypothetical protein [Frankia nepalensis]MBL7517413.1 hypothetical protein [Frankia nepalensis]MBL7626244.1 hypothetical protein [Frankia nepalensis]
MFPLLIGPLAGSAQDSITGVMQAMVAMFAASFGTRLGELLSAMFTASTRPPVTAQTFLAADGPYRTVASFSTLLLAVAIVIGVIQGLLSGQPGQAFARMGVQLPIAVLAIGGLPWLVDQMLAIADVLADAVLPPDKAREVTTLMAAPPSPDFPGLLVTVLAFLGGVLLYMELVVRDALILIVVALAPGSFAASVVPAARPAAGQVLRLITAAVLAKPAIYVALRIGIDQVAQHDDADSTGAGWGQYILGLAVVTVAVFMPAIVWRLLPLAEAYALSQGIARAPFRATMQTAQMAYWGRTLLAGRGRGLPGGTARTPTTGSTTPASDRPHFDTPRALPDPPPEPHRADPRPDPPPPAADTPPQPRPTPDPPPPPTPPPAGRVRRRRGRPEPGGAATPTGNGP